MAITIAELRRGVELIRYRGDLDQATLLKSWPMMIISDFTGHTLTFDAEAAQMWGRLRILDPAHDVYKQSASIALVNDVTVVTQNTIDFGGTGVRLINPFRS